MNAVRLASWTLFGRFLLRLSIFGGHALACVWFMHLRLLGIGFGWAMRETNSGSDSSLLELPSRWADLFQLTVAERPIAPGQSGIFRGELIEGWHSHLSPFPGVLLLNPGSHPSSAVAFALLTALTVLLAGVVSLIVSRRIIRKSLAYFFIQPQAAEQFRGMAASWETRALLISVPPSIIVAWAALLVGMDTDGWDVFSLPWAWFPWQSVLIGCAAIFVVQTLSTAVVSVAGAVRARREARFAEFARCTSCGYPAGAAVCPECGPPTTRCQLAQRLMRPAWVRPALLIAICLSAAAVVSLAVTPVRAAASGWVEELWLRDAENWRLNLLLRTWLFHRDDAQQLESPWSRTLRLELRGGDEMLIALRHFAPPPSGRSVQLYGPLYAGGLVSAVGFRTKADTEWRIDVQVHLVKDGYLNPYLWHTFARGQPLRNADLGSQADGWINIGTNPRSEHLFAAVVRGASVVAIKCVETTSSSDGVTQLDAALQQQATAQGLRPTGP